MVRRGHAQDAHATKNVGTDNPMRTAYTGPPGSGKTRKLIELFQQSRREGRESRTLFIVPDSTAREHLRDILTRFAPADVPSAFTDRGIHSLQSLVRRLGGTPSAGEMHCRAMIARWIDEKKLDSDRFPILKTTGGEAELASAVLTLRAHGHNSLTLAAATGSASYAESPLSRALALWEQWLKSSGSRDEQDVLKSAADAATKKQWDLVLIDGFTEFLPLQWLIVRNLIESSRESAIAIDPDQPPSRTLLDKLLRTGFAEQRPDAGTRWDECGELRWLTDIACWDIQASRPDVCLPTDRLKILRAASPRIEAATVAREVARLVADGLRFSDIAVLAPNLGTFRNTLEAEFRRAGMPIRFYLDRPLAETGAGALYDALLALASGDWSDESVTTLLSNPASGTPPSEAREAIVQTVAGKRLGTTAAWLDWSRGATRALLERIAKLLEPTAVDPVEFSHELVSIAEESLGISWADMPERLLAEEGWAWERVRTLLLDSARALGETWGRPAPGAIAQSLISELHGARARPLDRSRDCVNAVTLLQARTWGMPVAIVCGLAREYYPRTRTPNPFLPDSVRVNLDPPLPTCDELRQRELALFRIAVTRAHERLILVWPDADRDGNPLLPAGPLEKCVDWVLDGEKPPTIEHEPPIDVKDALFPKDIAAITLENAIEDAGIIEDLSTRYSRSLKDPVTQARYESVAISQGDELVRGACGSRESPIFPTDLNNLAQCPYKFFAHRLLRLRDPERDLVQRGFDYRQWGIVAHDALAEWFRSGKKADFDSLVRCAVGRRRELVASSVRDARAAQIADALRRFERFEKESIRPIGFEQKFAELFFGAGDDESPQTRQPVEIEIGGRTLVIGGRVDRIDLTNDSIALVADYKRSHKDEDTRKLKEGRDFQLACYTALVERGMGLRVGMACFLPLNRILVEGPGFVLIEPSLVPSVDAESFSMKDSSAPSEHLESALLRVNELIDSIASGGITPKPEDEDVCGKTCPYLDLCRYRLNGEEVADEGGAD